VARKGAKTNAGVREFFASAAQERTASYLSVITRGELRQGVERIRHQWDQTQAQTRALAATCDRQTRRAILPFEEDAADIWGRLRATHPENPLDKQIAATALIYDSIVVTRNTSRYQPTAARLLNPVA
jgi:predicted nucleic acid-binding protein